MSQTQRIKITDGKYLEISRVEVVGDFYDAPEGGNKIDSGNNAINLNSAEVASLGMTDIQTLADKFNSNNQQENQG